MIGRRGGLEPETVFTSQDVARLAGVSLRQLQWWDEQGVVSPLHRSHRRLYSRFEVLQVSLIIGLRRKGISLQKTRGVLKKFEDQCRGDYFTSLGGDSDLYLLTDGENVHLENSPDAIVEIVRDSKRPVIALSVSDMVRNLTGAAERPKPVRREQGSASARPGRIKRAS